MVIYLMAFRLHDVAPVPEVVEDMKVSCNSSSIRLSVSVFNTLMMSSKHGSSFEWSVVL